MSWTVLLPLREHQWSPLPGPSSFATAAIAAWSRDGSIAPFTRATQALVSSISSCVSRAGLRTDTGTKLAARVPLCSRPVGLGDDGVMGVGCDEVSRARANRLFQS